MAERRMLAKTIVCSDAFTSMPFGAQALYVQLCMGADDDGFVNNAKQIQKALGVTSKDMDVLIDKRFILVFENGLVVIKHWKMNNYIQKDRYKHTVYEEEKSQLTQKENGAYTFLDTKCIHSSGYSLDTQVRLGKVSIGKVRLVKSKDIPTQKEKFAEFVTMTKDEYQKLVDELGEVDTKACIDILDNYKGSKGKTYKSDYRAIRSWVITSLKERKAKTPTIKAVPKSKLQDFVGRIKRGDFVEQNGSKQADGNNSTGVS
jgi:hypothetical protein